MYKAIATQSPSYLLNVISRNNTTCSIRVSNNILMLGTKHIFFLNSYFSSAIKEWDRLDIDIRKSDSISIFINCIHCQIIFPVLSIHKDSNFLKSCTYVSVICVIINSNITFWIPLIHSVAVALMSKQLFIFFVYSPIF